MNFMEAMDLVEKGLKAWAEKEHNRKWWRKIDGTPIPNDLCVVIAETIAAAPVPPPAEPTPDLVETVATGRDGVQRRVYVDRARGVVMEASPPAESGEVEDPWREAGEKQVQVHEALQDSAYRAGARAGWNAQFADEPDAAIERLTRYPKGALSIIHEKRAYEKITSSNPPAAKTGVVKLLDMSNLLKHAWQAGKNGVEWVDYDPDDTPAYGRISSALASHTPAPQPGGAVKVKALEWSPVEHERSNEDPTTEIVGYEASTGFWCHYSVEITGGGATLTNPEYSETEHASPDAAKAAAQADYERRIRAALEPSPAQWNAGAEAMREACALEAERIGIRWAEDAAHPEAHRSAGRDISAAIRALPLPTPPGEG